MGTIPQLPQAARPAGNVSQRRVPGPRSLWRRLQAGGAARNPEILECEARRVRAIGGQGPDHASDRR